MSLSQTAGTAIVPTLSRILLAAVFITTGADKLFRTGTYDAAQAAQLRELGVEAVPVPAGAAASPTASAHDHAIVLARHAQEAPGGAPPEDETEDEPGRETGSEETEDAPVPVTPPADPAPTGDDEEDRGELMIPPAPPAGDVPSPPVPPILDAEPVDAAPAPDDGTVYRAANYHHITLLADGANVPLARHAGLATGVTELVGGVFLLIGFMTRLWAFALAVVMAVAFWIVSMRLQGVHTISPMAHVQDHDLLHATVTRLSLLLFALGVTLTGAGPLSVDRLLFRRAQPVRRAATRDDAND